MKKKVRTKKKTPAQRQREWEKAFGGLDWISLVAGIAGMIEFSRVRSMLKNKTAPAEPKVKGVRVDVKRAMAPLSVGRAVTRGSVMKLRKGK